MCCGDVAFFSLRPRLGVVYTARRCTGGAAPRTYALSSRIIARILDSAPTHYHAITAFPKHNNLAPATLLTFCVGSVWCLTAFRTAALSAEYNNCNNHTLLTQVGQFIDIEDGRAGSICSPAILPSPKKRKRILRQYRKIRTFDYFFMHIFWGKNVFPQKIDSAPIRPWAYYKQHGNSQSLSRVFLV